MSLRTMAAATATLLLAAGSAEAGILHYAAVLKGANMTPPTASHARGEITAVVDTDRRTFDYTVSFTGLSGPATSAVFQEHGAAVLPALATPALKDPQIHATVTLTAAQIDDLNAGRWRFDISTLANPGGEIGGELTRAAGAY
jgi:hypothetical protein